MPPGNSNNKAPIAEKCSYCGKTSCKGESSHFNPLRRYPVSTSLQTSGSTVIGSGIRSDYYRETTRIVSLSKDVKSTPPETKINNTNPKPNLTVGGIRTFQFEQKASVLEKSLNVPGSVGSASSNQNDGAAGISSVGSASSNQNEGAASISSTVCHTSFVGSKQVGGSSLVVPPKEEVKVDTDKDLKEKQTNKIFEKFGTDKADGNELPQSISHISKIKREEKTEDIEKDFEIIYNYPKNDGKRQASINNETDMQVSQKKHSRRSVTIEGVVERILGSRMADVRVGDDDEVKFVQLFIEKLLPSSNKPAYTSSTNMNSVLRVGEVLKLVCTTHNKKDSRYHYFAQAAWKTENETTPSNSCSNYDAESVTSYVSHDSLPESETQGSKSLSRRRRRKRKVTPECNADGLSYVIYEWLDKSESSQGSKKSSKDSLIVEGCEYFGKVLQLRLPFAFVVEVSFGKFSECVFVFSLYFHPEGPNSKSLTNGVTIKGLVNVGDVVNVIPVRANQQKQRDFEWVARKAWLKPKDFGIKHSVVEEIQNISEQAPAKPVELFQLRGLDPTDRVNDYDGAILTLQTDWGLVREMRNASAYVFTRKNAYLFGLCLKSFVLEDVFREGQLVKFSRGDGEIGLMNAQTLYCGNELPDFNSFVKAICHYCQERKIKISVETSLVSLGERLYCFK